MLAYTGGYLNIEDWDHPVVVEIAGIEVPRMPKIRLDHSAEKRVGHADKVDTATGREVIVEGQISSSSEHAREVCETADQGFPWQSSIGAVPSPGEVDFYHAGQTFEANGRTFEGPAYHVKRSRLGEVSFVDVGGDVGAEAIVARLKQSQQPKKVNASNQGRGDQMDFEQWVESCGIKASQLSEEEKSALLAVYNRGEQPVTADSAIEQIAQAMGPDVTADDVRAMGDDDQVSANDQVTADDQVSASDDVSANDQVHARSQGDEDAEAQATGRPVSAEDVLNTIATAMSEFSAQSEQTVTATGDEATASDQETTVAAAAQSGNSLQAIVQKEVKAAMLQNVRGNRPTQTRRRQIHAASQISNNVRAIEASLAINAGRVSQDSAAKTWGDQAVDRASHADIRGLTLHGLMHQCIRAAGMSYPGGQKGNGFIEAAFTADQKLRRIQAAGVATGGFSTLSLSGILSNVANKALVNMFEQVEDVASKISAPRNVTDFKEFASYRMVGIGEFQVVGATGELKHMELDEAEYKNRAETHGVMLTLNRQMIINDDLGAFLQIVNVLGRKAAIKKQKITFTKFLENPAGSDTFNFFSTDHANLETGAGSAMQISSLTTAEQKFRDQTDEDGDPCLISPAILLSGTALAVTAQQLMTETRVNETTTANKPKPADNPHAGKWEPVSSPYINAQGISGSSATAWWLLADPADVPVLEIAYLNGKQTPVIESGETSFERLGMSYRSYFDFGVALQEWRGGVKADGA